MMRSALFLTVLGLSTAAQATCMSFCNEDGRTNELLTADCTPHDGLWPADEPVVFRSSCVTECCGGGPPCTQSVVAPTLELSPGDVVLSHAPEHACGSNVFVSDAPLAGGHYAVALLPDAEDITYEFQVEGAGEGCRAMPGGSSDGVIWALLVLGALRRRQ